MTKGVLGVVLCPMLDDNLLYSLCKDPEEKHITLVDHSSNVSVKRKLRLAGIPFDVIGWDDVLGWRYEPVKDAFNILILTTDLGLHARPDVLKSTVEERTEEMQPFVDAIGFYLGTCGNYEWDIPAWSDSRGFKPSETFRDSNGRLCHDCVGVNIAGGPRYGEMQKAFVAHLFVFPAMATNFDDFMNADSADSAATEESLTDEMREALGIEEGRDGYLRWLLSLGGYQNILKIDTGLGDHEEFDRATVDVARRTGLNIKDAPEGWASLQPTDDLYARCKGFLQGRSEERHGLRQVLPFEMHGMGLAVFCGISYREDVHQRKAFGDPEGAAYRDGVEVTDPARPQAQIDCLQHHVVGDDGRVRLRYVPSGEAADPCLVLLGEDQHHQRGAEGHGAVRPDLPEGLGRLEDVDPLALGVLACGGEPAGLQDPLYLPVLHRPRVVLPDGIPLLDYFIELHAIAFWTL